MRKAILLSISALSFFNLTAFSVFGTDLPKCDSSEAQTSLAKIMNNALKDDGIKFINSKNVKEEGFNKKTEIRVCSADILFSNGSRGAAIYNVYWENKSKKMYMVEVTNFSDY